MFDPLQVDTTVRGMVKVPAVVGEPFRIFVKKDSPPGMEVDAIENMLVPVEEAVSAYVNAWPTMPEAVREEVNCGARQTPPIDDTGITLTMRVAVVVAPCESDTRYVTEYVPVVLALTLLVVMIREVMLPSSASKAVAPRSVYTVPTVVVAGFGPRIVMTGD
jgi:hypothetical protein